MKRASQFFDLSAQESSPEEEEEEEEIEEEDSRLFVDDSDDDLEDASMDVDRLPVPQREFDEVAERILDRIRQGQTDYQAAARRVAHSESSIVEDSPSTSNEIPADVDLFCVRITAARAESRVQSLESLTKEKLISNLHIPRAPRAPDAKAILNAFFFAQDPGIIYVLTPTGRINAVLKAAGIKLLPALIPHEDWQDSQPWSSGAQASSIPPWVTYCTPIPANVGLFRVPVPVSLHLRDGAVIDHVVVQRRQCKNAIQTLKNLTMADLNRVREGTVDTGIAALITRQAIEGVEGKLIRVFSVPALPGRLFIFTSAKLITLALRTVRIYATPTLIPREEWYGDKTLPWAHSHWEVGSLLKIQRGRYHGSLAYVVGSSKDNDAIIVAVVPRLTTEDFHRTTPQTKRPRLDHAAPPLTERKIKMQWKEALFSPENTERLEQERRSSVKPSTKTEDTNKKCALIKHSDGSILSRRLGVGAGDVEWLIHPSSEDPVYEYRRQFFYRSLLILRLDGHRSVESTLAVTTKAIEPFVLSRIHVSFDQLLSQMSWKSGQLTKGKEGALYRIITPHLDQREADVVTAEGEPLSMVMRMDQLCPHFVIGDEVIVLVGQYKDRWGFVLVNEGSFVTILDNTKEQIRVPILWLAGHFSSHSLESAYPIGAAVDFADRHGHKKRGVIVNVYQDETIYVKPIEHSGFQKIVSIPKNQILKVYQRQDTQKSAEGRALRLYDYARVESKGLFYQYNGKAGYVENITDNLEFRLRGGSIGEESLLVPAEYLSLVDIRKFDLVTVRTERAEQDSQMDASGRLVLRDNKTCSVSEVSGDGRALLLGNEDVGQLWIQIEDLVLVSRVCMGDQVDVVAGLHTGERATVLSDVDANGAVDVGSYSTSGEAKVIGKIGVMDLRAINATYHSLGHPWLRRLVLIGGEHPWKGKQGEVISYTPAHNTFGVWVHGTGDTTCRASALTLVHSRTSTAINDSESSSQAYGGTLGNQTAALRESTPVPSDDMDFIDQVSEHFLHNPIWRTPDSTVHVLCAFVPGNSLNMRASRTARTSLPFLLDSNTQSVSSYWTNNKSKPKKGMILLKDLECVKPKQKQQHVMVLEGERRGQTAVVEKFNYGKCYLKGSNEQWVQTPKDLCVIVPHSGDGGVAGCGCAVEATDI